MKLGKRTLKGRVNIVILLSIIMTVLLFGGAILYLAISFSKSEATLLTKYMGFNISQEMNSDCFLKNRVIKGLEEFDPQKPDCKDWIEHLKERQSFDLLCSESDEQTTEKEKEIKEGNISDTESKKDSDSKDEKSTEYKGMLFFDMAKMVSTNIVLNNKVIYKSENVEEGKSLDSHKKTYTGLKKFINSFYSESNSSYPLYGSSGKVVGSITTEVNIDYMASVIASLFFGILVIGLISLIIAGIVSRLLVTPLIKPLAVLNEKIRSLATEDKGGYVNKQIILNKPLEEIKELAESTNMVIQKIESYNELLKDQKEELEAQNLELLESRKQVEETQALLVQTEKMASVGQLTAAITHEINTPLGAINSNVQLSAMILDTVFEDSTVLINEELKELLSQVRDANNTSLLACNRVSEIVKCLKDFTKIDQAEYQEVNIIEGVKSALTLTSNLWIQRIKIHEKFEDIPKVKCFPGLLNQVFMNIIVNAIQSIENTGDIYIHTYIKDNAACISFKDTGSGIKEENISKIFETNFSTKKSNLGTGLGLSICNNIIKKHNGEIKVTSELGKGSEFIVCLPLD